MDPPSEIQLNNLSRTQLHSFLKTCSYEHIENIRETNCRMKPFIDRNRRSYQKQQMQSLILANDLMKTRLAVKLHHIKTTRINNFANWVYKKDDGYNLDIHGLDPQWLIVDTKLNPLKQLDSWWLEERKKVSLNDNVNTVDALTKWFKNATHFELQTVRRANLGNILDNMPNLVHLKLHEKSTKVTCSNSDFEQLAEEFSEFEYLEIQPTLSSKITLGGLVEFLKKVNCITEATFKFWNIKGLRRCFERLIKADTSFHPMIKEGAKYVLNRTDGIRMNVYFSFEKEN